MMGSAEQASFCEQVDLEIGDRFIQVHRIQIENKGYFFRDLRFDELGHNCTIDRNVISGILQIVTFQTYFNGSLLIKGNERRIDRGGSRNLLRENGIGYSLTDVQTNPFKGCSPLFAFMC